MVMKTKTGRPKPYMITRHPPTLLLSIPHNPLSAWRCIGKRLTKDSAFFKGLLVQPFFTLYSEVRNICDHGWTAEGCKAETEEGKEQAASGGVFFFRVQIA
jgi:hypothetical protein